MSRQFPLGAEIIGLAPRNPVEQAVLDVVAERAPIAPLDLYNEVRKRTGRPNVDAQVAMWEAISRGDLRFTNTYCVERSPGAASQQEGRDDGR